MKKPRTVPPARSGEGLSPKDLSNISSPSAQRPHVLLGSSMRRRRAELLFYPLWGKFFLHPIALGLVGWADFGPFASHCSHSRETILITFGRFFWPSRRRSWIVKRPPGEPRGAPRRQWRRALPDGHR